MERFSLNEIIEQAVQTEKVGYKFYSAASEKFKADSGLSELFGTLASKEKTHEERFSELKDSAGKDEGQDWEEVSKYLRAIVESEFFLGRDKSLSLLEKVKTVNEAVKSAIGFEKETLLYFYGMRDLLGTKEILEAIIREEKEHIIWLTNFERSLTKQ